MGVARGNIRTTLVVDGEQEYYQIMQKLRSQQTTLRSEMNALASTYDENTTATEKLNDKKEVLTKQIEIQKQMVQGYKEELDKEISANGDATQKCEKLTTQYNNAAAKLNNLEKELEAVNDELSNNGEALKAAGEQISDFGGKVESAGEKISGAGKKMSALSAGIGAALYKAADAAIDYESAFAGVRKTVDASEEEFDELYSAIIDLSTEIPTTASDIASVAEVAGQLGIQTDSLLDFTEVMINLGESTNLTAEDAASSLAKFANITGMAAEDYERLGSVIVDLGNNYATTEADIVSMATRLASTGNLTGLSQSQIMAVATALNSVGIEAEAGGSAMSKFLKQIQVAVETNSENLQQFASVSNMTVSEFKELWGKDAVAAVGAFTDGLNDTERNGKTAIAVLNDMGITETRLSNTILALASSNGLLSGAVDTANNAWEENTALQNEANQRYETLASKIQICKDVLNKVAIEFGEELMPYVEKGIEKIRNLAERVSSLSDTQKQTVIKIAAVVTAAGPLLLVLGKTTSAVGTLITAGGKLIKTIGKIKTGEAITQFRNFRTALQNVSESSEAAKSGTTALASAFGSNAALCIGIAATVATIALLVAAYKEINYGSKETRKTMEALGDGIDDFKDKMNNAASAVDDIKKSLNFDESNAELESQYDSIQSEISEIAKIASETRRELTDAEVERLEALFGQLETVNDKEFELFRANQIAVQDYIKGNTNASLEELASYAQAANDTAAEAIEAVEKQFNQSILAISDLSEQEYEAERDRLNTQKSNNLKAVKETTSETYNLLLTSMLKQNGLYDVMQSKFSDYTSEMIDIESRYYEKSLQNEKDAGLTNLIDAAAYYKKRKSLNEEFSAEFLKDNQEVISAYLSAVEEMLAAGGTLDEENAAIVESIIAAFKTLPKSASEPWKETMEYISSAIDSFDIEEKGKGVGTAFTDGVVRGLNLTRHKAEEAAEKTGAAVFESVRGYLDIHSPSKKGEWLMEMFNAGIVNELDRGKDEIYDKAGEIAEGIVESMETEATIEPNVKFPQLAARYAASVAGSNAMQAIYNQTYVNNNTSATNYYSTASSADQTASAEIKAFREQLIPLLNTAFADTDNVITERQAGRVILKCLKSVGM